MHFICALILKYSAIYRVCFAFVPLLFADSISPTNLHYSTITLFWVNSSWSCFKHVHCSKPRVEWRLILSNPVSALCPLPSLALLFLFNISSIPMAAHAPFRVEVCASILRGVVLTFVSHHTRTLDLTNTCTHRKCGSTPYLFSNTGTHTQTLPVVLPGCSGCRTVDFTSRGLTMLRYLLVSHLVDSPCSGNKFTWPLSFNGVLP